MRGRDDDRISGYLDGELSEVELSQFKNDLSEDAALRDQLDQIAAVRGRLRTMGDVAAPFGFFERIVNRERRHRRVGALMGVAAIAAALLVLVSATPVAEPIEFVVGIDQLVAQHATASADMSSMIELDDDHKAHILGEADLSTMDLTVRHAVRTSDGTDWVQYGRKDGTMLSVFRQPGTLAAGWMPDDAEAMEMGGDDAWIMQRLGRDVLVAEHDSMVFTLVADDYDDLMNTMHHELPDASGGLSDDLSNAAMVVIDLFSFS